MYNKATKQLADEENRVLFYALLEEGFVRTNCGDFYYDYDISFDDFIKFAEFIKKERRDGK